MFRELSRKNRAASQEECIRMLESEKRGVLAVQGDDGYPYCMPMNHWYDPESGCIWFHAGHGATGRMHSAGATRCPTACTTRVAPSTAIGPSTSPA